MRRILLVSSVCLVAVAGLFKLAATPVPTFPSDPAAECRAFMRYNMGYDTMRAHDECRDVPEGIEGAR